jgi:RNA polymerase sigma-70 factor (ECF subfamily)
LAGSPVAFLLRAYASAPAAAKGSDEAWRHDERRGTIVSDGKLHTAPPRMKWKESLVQGHVGHEGPLLPREEQQLMEGLLAGDDAAIRALYERFGRPVYTMGLRLLGSREAAEELTQDVFLTAWRKAARFDPQRGRLSTWLMTIAHNLAVDRLRRETGVSRPHLVLVDEVPDQPAGDEEFVLIERDEALRALASLSVGEKRLIARVYFRGMTAREISEADGIPLGTVKTRLRSALIKVRRANETKEQP